MNGDIKNTPILLPFDDFQFYKVDSSILIGKQKIGINTYKFVGYDFENGFQSITIDAFEYDNDNISFLSRKNEMLNFLFKSAMTDFIGVNDIQIVYMNTFY
ncbi:MAG: hypothetical protein K2G83_06925, partial [Ruminococcus sp.]|nr:hypothetical protein [Ruminococcus sp.]